VSQLPTSLFNKLSTIAMTQNLAFNHLTEKTPPLRQRGAKPLSGFNAFAYNSAFNSSTKRNGTTVPHCALQLRHQRLE